VAAKRLTCSDRVFRQFVWERWRDSALRAHFVGFGHYRLELYTVGGALAVLTIALCSGPFFRIFRSWVEGVSSGLGLIWALSFFYYFAFEGIDTTTRFVGAIALGLLLSFLSIAFNILSISRRSRTPSLPAATSTVKSALEKAISDLETDSPIETAESRPAQPI
jgi:hypothetical protein